MVKQVTRTAVIRRIKSRLKAGQGFEYDRVEDKWFITHGSDIIEDGLTVEVMVERLNALKAWEEMEPTAHEKAPQQKPAAQTPPAAHSDGLGDYAAKFGKGQVKDEDL